MVQQIIARSYLQPCAVVTGHGINQFMFQMFHTFINSDRGGDLGTIMLDSHSDATGFFVAGNQQDLGDPPSPRTLLALEVLHRWPRHLLWFQGVHETLSYCFCKH